MILYFRNRLTIFLNNIGLFIVLGITAVTIFNSARFYSLKFTQVISGVLMISTVPVMIIFISSNMFSSLKNDFRIVLTQKKRTDEKKVSFITYKPGVSNFVHNIDIALKQMKYVMTNEERVSLKGQSRKNKEQIFIGVVSDSQWKSFCQSFGLVDFIEDKDMDINSGRVEKRVIIIPKLQELFKTFTK